MVIKLNHILLLFLGGCILLAGLYYFNIISFAGLFDKKYSREELVKNFIEHENEFAELEAFFVSVTSNIKERQISFGLGKGGRVSLTIYPIVIDPANKIIGGSDLKIGSPKLDSALNVLSWSNSIVDTLKERLIRTNCDWITTTESPYNVISVYPSQSGWQKYTYGILEKPVPDSIAAKIGKPISNSEFGKRVILSYYSAL